jgi:hypothetical protein
MPGPTIIFRHLLTGKCDSPAGIALTTGGSVARALAARADTAAIVLCPAVNAVGNASLVVQHFFIASRMWGFFLLSVLIRCVDEHVPQQSLRGGMLTQVLADPQCVQDDASLTEPVDGHGQAGGVVL